MLLLLAMLRAHTVPVRGRRGFGTYFNPGFFEDHVVCEYWNAAQARGLWFIADNLVHDVATLNKLEMLQWDTWGSMPSPGESLDESRLAFFDRFAMVTRSPDASFSELRRLYGQDGITVPPSVYNAVLNRVEVV